VARLPVDDAERFAAWLLAEFEYRGETVMLTPMRSFYATPGAGRDEVRLALVHGPETLVRAAEILAAGLAAYPGRTA
jgi:aspartate aminotransferase